MSALPGTTGRRRIYLMRHGHVDYFSEVVKKTMIDKGVFQDTSKFHNQSENELSDYFRNLESRVKESINMPAIERAFEKLQKLHKKELPKDKSGLWLDALEIHNLKQGMSIQIREDINYELEMGETSFTILSDKLKYTYPKLLYPLLDKIYEEKTSISVMNIEK